MKRVITIILLALTANIFPQNEFQKFISHIDSIPDVALKTMAVDSFMNYARSKGIPFITGDSANFLYRGTITSASVASDFNLWSATSFMTRIPQTNLWYYSREFELDARLDYKFVTNGSNWILDPENPNKILGGFGANSELAMPEYIQPWEIVYKSQVNHGTVITKNIFSTAVGATYQLKIYLPPGYDSLSTTEYPSVYFQDGFEYVSLANAVNVLDNLLDSNKIQPVIAVFVKPNNRNVEYADSIRQKYRSFFVNELVPFIDNNYNTKKSPDQRLVLGDSYGGNISALISYNHPDVFGNCGLHSGAFQPNGFEIYAQVMTDLANGITKNIKWSSIWGSYEGTLTINMDVFKDSLLKNGYKVDWEKRPEGHSWGLWRATIDKMLIYFFPAQATDIEEEFGGAPVNFVLIQNYPNPFNPITKIKYSIPVETHRDASLHIVTLKVYDILGNEVAVLVNEQKPAGNYEVEFSAAGRLASGVYIYRLQANGLVSSKKMILLK